MEKTKNRHANSQVPIEIRSFARLLDSQFRVGKFRFGLDPILGLVPGLGDFFSALLSGGIIAMAARHGASGKVMVLMSLNALLDATIGSIPIVGALFDFFFKANERNVRMLEKHYSKGKYKGSGKGLIIVVILLFLGLAGLTIFLMWKLLTYILSLI
jgi:hypothetical protein